MKRFNQLTEKQMTKTDGGLVLAAIAIGGSTLAAGATACGIGLAADKGKL